MLPDRCSIMENRTQCVNPPKFVVSVLVEKDEYMVGVTCDKHKQIVSGKIILLQNEKKIPDGKINFSPLKSVGTDCIHGDMNDFVQLDSKSTKN